MKSLSHRCQYCFFIQYSLYNCCRYGLWIKIILTGVRNSSYIIQWESRYLENALSRTKTSVPSAFKPSLGKICHAISNLAISKCFFGPLRQITIEFLLKPLIHITVFVFIRTFDFRNFEGSMNWMFYFELCLSVFLYFYTCLLYTSPSPRDKRQSRMPSSAWK